MNLSALHVMVTENLKTRPLSTQLAQDELALAERVIDALKWVYEKHPHHHSCICRVCGVLKDLKAQVSSQEPIGSDRSPTGRKRSAVRKMRPNT